MSMRGLDEKTCARLRRLLALADRGVGGERDTAYRSLHALLKQHGLTLADLEGEQEKVVTLTLAQANSEEQALLTLLLLDMLGYEELQALDAHSASRSLHVRMRESTGRAVEVAWDVYRAAYRKERKATLEALPYAFARQCGFQANGLPERSEPATDEQRAQWARQSVLEMTLEPVARPSRRLAGSGRA